MIALITGATSGIGRSCAKLFAKNNYNLIITGRRLDRLQELKLELENTFNINVTVLNFDIRSQTEVESALNILSREQRKIDLLINNAGLAAGLNSFQNGELSHWEQMIDTNVKGLIYVSKIVSNWMIEYNNGQIINVGSIAGKEVYANGNVYCATKHAVDALTKAMRIDLLPHAIRVGAVHPGMVETEFSLVRFEGDTERAKKVYEGLTPLNPDDVAETIFWMTSRPKHVNINDVIIMPSAQATSTVSIRK